MTQKMWIVHSEEPGLTDGWDLGCQRCGRIIGWYHVWRWAIHGADLHYRRCFS